VPKALAEKYGPVAPVWAPRRSTRPHAAARTACQRATGRARAVNHDALAPFGRPPRARAVNRDALAPSAGRLLFLGPAEDTGATGRSAVCVSIRPAYPDKWAVSSPLALVSSQFRGTKA
jgi:hypothetical protein